MIRYHFGIFMLWLVISMGNCVHPQDHFETDWLALAKRTEAHIQKAKYREGSMTAWRVMPDSVESKGDASLYSGAPGIVLFYLELFNSTGDSTYLLEAIQGGEYLIQQIPDSLPTWSEVGLYTGVAGIGYTLNELYLATGHQSYLDQVYAIVDILKQSSQKTKTGIQWWGITDIVYGSAGIGLFLQYVADKLDYPVADDLASLAANGLLDAAKDTLEGYRWKFTPQYQRYLDNFSHGTAGVGYFMAVSYIRTNENKYLEAALKAAHFLDQLDNEKGYVPHHSPGGDSLFYLNWCHGPPGTSRLYYLLYEITKETQWLNKIVHTGDHMMEEGIHSIYTPGFWNNVGKCCGKASVAEYYLWLFHITGKTAYKDYALKMTDQFIEEATDDVEYLKWVHAENRTSPETVAAQTGLMQGSAGIGLWFLELEAEMKGITMRIHLPDKPVIQENTIRPTSEFRNHN